MDGLQEKDRKTTKITSNIENPRGLGLARGGPHRVCIILRFVFLGCGFCGRFPKSLYRFVLSFGVWSVLSQLLFFRPLAVRLQLM